MPVPPPSSIVQGRGSCDTKVADIGKVNIRGVIGSSEIEGGFSIRRIFHGSTEKHVAVVTVLR